MEKISCHSKPSRKETSNDLPIEGYHCSVKDRLLGKYRPIKSDRENTAAKERLYLEGAE